MALTDPAPAKGLARPNKTTGNWASDILNALGAPNTSNNQANLAAWNHCEGNSAGGSGLPINNPFNTTLPFAGSSRVNSVGVQSFHSWSDGVTATVMTIRQDNMRAIHNALMSDAPRDQLALALSSDPWGTNGQCVAGASGTLAGMPGGTGTGAGTGGATDAQLASSTGSNSNCGDACAVCIQWFPSIKVPLVNISGPKTCIWYKGWSRALLGGVLITGGGVVLLTGVVLLVSSATKAGQASVAALGMVGRVPAVGSRYTGFVQGRRDTYNARHTL